MLQQIGVFCDNQGNAHLKQVQNIPVALNNSIIPWFINFSYLNVHFWHFAELFI